MKKYTLFILSIILIGTGFLSRCKPDDDGPTKPDSHGTPFDFGTIRPKGFPTPNIPADNPMTEEGIELGHHLFFDKRLSGDLTMSCAGCHNQNFFFADLPSNPTSLGIAGIKGRRNAMPLFNLAWQEFFFWDGRAMSLEEQSLHPIIDPVELNTDLPTVISRLELDSVYPDMFRAAFGDNEITDYRIAKALAQFERTIVSAESKFDRVERVGTDSYTPEEARGRELFFSDFTSTGARGGDCFHCHGAVETSYLMGSFGKEGDQFRNNGFKANYTSDEGRAEVTNKPSDVGKFKIPSVRNVQFTFPYMHDGSLGTGADPLMELIEFYNSGIHASSPNLDPNMTQNGFVDKNWTDQQKKDLKAFLETLTDFTLQEDSAFQNPFEE